ncbi:MAG TPA: cysteine--tRNA ligase, partial [Panacibacter sp.]|nr:cysteine--tRNA ligase [Panacibacter sp.]
DIFGLQNMQDQNNGKIDGVIHLLMDIRKDAKKRKDYLTSDKIRNELIALGIQLKDEKDGSMSYTLA